LDGLEFIDNFFSCLRYLNQLYYSWINILNDVFVRKTAARCFDLTKMALSCELSQVAYSKIILHALKYPHTAINGVLLANEGSNSQSLKYIDAIPLFHNNLGLAPMLEVALMQVEFMSFIRFNRIEHSIDSFILQIDSYCRTNGLVIAGYYQANETLGELG